MVTLCPRAEDVGTISIRDGEPRTSTSTLTQLLSSDSSWFVQFCLTSTSTVRTIRDGEPRTSTSNFTQLLNSVVLLHFCVALRPQRLYGLLGTSRTSTSTFTQLLNSVVLLQFYVTLCPHAETVRTIRDIQDIHLDFHTAIELCCSSQVLCCFRSTDTVRRRYNPSLYYEKKKGAL